METRGAWLGGCQEAETGRACGQLVAFSTVAVAKRHDWAKASNPCWAVPPVLLLSTRLVQLQVLPPSQADEPLFRVFPANVPML